MDTTNRMSTSEFNKISTYIFTEFGIKMPPGKKTMLESRLQKRLRELQIKNFTHYFDYVFSTAGRNGELINMIDLVTTNKTDFFREADHFSFITNQVLPSYEHEKPLKIWSAGCSSGEEGYTLCMMMNEFIEQYFNINYSIYATDLSTEVLSKGIKAVYSEERVATIPLLLKRKYFLKSKDSTIKTVRILPELRKKITFQRLNFMDDSYSVPHPFDIIFCRNVLIYFDRETQEKVIKKLCDKLKPGGYFFLGHSESITDMEVPLKQIKPTVFVKTN